MARLSSRQSKSRTAEGTIKQQSADSWEVRAAIRAKGPQDKPGFWRVANKEPNAATLEAMQELEEGRGQRFGSVDALFEDLGV